MKRVVARESQIVGTYDDEMIVALMNAGTLKMADLYWEADSSTWRPLTDFVGKGAPTRRGNGFPRAVTLLAAAGCGALFTWWTMTSVPQNPTVAPVVGAIPANSAMNPTAGAAGTPEVSRESAAQNPVAEAPRAEAKLALLNVEAFDDEVAVTVQNNGAAAVNGFDLRLSYFVLPGVQRVFDGNEKAIAQHEVGTQERAERAKILDEMLGALKESQQLLDTEVVTWTPSHIRALPTAGQWMSFGHPALSSAGAALTRIAAEFAEGASSADPVARKQALTERLPNLSRQIEETKPFVMQAIGRKSAARDRLTEEQKDADETLAKLKKQQADLQPRLPALMADARKTPIRSEVRHLDAIVEPGLVQRLTIPREKDERHGVAVELVPAKNRNVAATER